MTCDELQPRHVHRAGTYRQWRLCTGHLILTPHLRISPALRSRDSILPLDESAVAAAIRG